MMVNNTEIHHICVGTNTAKHTENLIIQGREEDKKE
jgi:hypothetical protein